MKTEGSIATSKDVSLQPLSREILTEIKCQEAICKMLIVKMITNGFPPEPGVGSRFIMKEVLNMDEKVDIWMEKSPSMEENSTRKFQKIENHQIEMLAIKNSVSQCKTQ